ncbi:hypothetical protein Bandiella_00638 [Candidatus Bandiella woodruffii]|uniref:Uncharacterized protein n=1 Tax=Candidatus Bandiella euplotis TaxID=1664265 RepID=A0ABZ0UKP8_9RICK|nr:hypothetical protein Bandiella_00638 [Candidatus Bandiella woodruffii]
MEKYTNNLKVFASYYRCDRAKMTMPTFKRREQSNFLKSYDYLSTCNKSIRLFIFLSMGISKIIGFCVFG